MKDLTAHSIEDVLNDLRIELEKHGFDTSNLTNEDLKNMLKEAEIEIIPNHLLN